MNLIPGVKELIKNAMTKPKKYVLINIFLL